MQTASFLFGGDLWNVASCSAKAGGKELDGSTGACPGFRVDHGALGAIPYLDRIAPDKRDSRTLAFAIRSFIGDQHFDSDPTLLRFGPRPASPAESGH
jgi:hypothetical protein